MLKSFFFFLTKLKSLFSTHKPDVLCIAKPMVIWKCGADKLANHGHKYFRFSLIGLLACFLAGGLLT
jgi:hypothetical protein